MKNSITNKERRSIYRRDGWQCALCGCHDGLQIHHAIPRGQHGSNSPMNLITLCPKCHAEAHGYEPECYYSTDDVQQACIEYLADLYAPEWYAYDCVFSMKKGVLALPDEWEGYDFAALTQHPFTR